MDQERPLTRSGSEDQSQMKETIERPITRWRRDDRPMSRSGENEDGNKRAVENRPVSRRGLKEEHPQTDRLQSRIGPEGGTRGNSSWNNTSSGYNSYVGTASRLSSAMMRAPSRTAATPMNIVGPQIASKDRLVTGDGLSGMNTVSSSRGVGQRQVLDKRYFEGLIQVKMREIRTEIARLHKEIETYNKEHAAFLLYDKRVKEAATELTELQDTLADYNLFVDKVNTSTDIRDIIDERVEYQASNQSMMRKLEQLYEERSRKQQSIAEIEEEIDLEKHTAELLLADMSSAMKEQYLSLRESISVMQETIDKLQQQLDALNFRKTELLDHISLIPVKIEAARLLQKLAELEERHNTLIQEESNKLSPELEQERLLSQVKTDNAEITSIERSMSLLQDQIKFTKKQIETANQDLEESQSERQQKYQELKKREETIETFLATFETSKADEIQRLSNLENKIVKYLTKLSKHLVMLPPSVVEYDLLEKDLISASIFKGENTVESLTLEHRQMEMTFDKLSMMEKRIVLEIQSLKEKISSMKEELKTFNDLDSLQNKFETEKKELSEKKGELLEMRQSDVPSLQETKMKYEQLQKKLNENETYALLKSLEKKLELLEQNNFALKEYIATKKLEMDYESIKSSTLSLMKTYNEVLADELVIIRK